jgi:hypothetical protein
VDVGVDESGERIGADRRPHRNQLSISGMMMEVPSTVLVHEVWMRRVFGE